MDLGMLSYFKDMRLRNVLLIYVNKILISNLGERIDLIVI